MPNVNPLTVRHRAFGLPVNLCTHIQNVSRAALARTAIPYSDTSLAITSLLLRHGLISNVSLGGPISRDPTIFPQLSEAQKRIWIDMKYRNGIPVLRRADLISKPSRRVSVTREELGRILTGRRANNVAGVGVGEIVVLKAPPKPEMGGHGKDTVMEGWEAWRAGLGGELLMRVS